MTAEQSALVEPYSVAIHAVNLGAPGPGDEVVVVGAGPVGLLTIAALAAQGISQITVVEPSATRAAVASRLGAGTVLSDISELSDGETTERSLVIECSGASGLIEQSIRVARMGGRVVILGVPSVGEVISLSPRGWTRKEVGLIPSIWYTIADFEQARDRIAAGTLGPGLLEVEVRPMSTAAEVFDEIATGTLVKVQLDPRQ
jgi:threonine dehydrogenase-like Zn-dependent dehydrogenase